MDDEAVSVMYFVLSQELESWKRVKFDWSNHIAVRQCGESHAFAHEDDAKKFIRVRAMRAALNHYHSKMAA